MFRMLGNKVELIRYVVTYTENDIEIVERCISTEHIDEVIAMLKSKNIEFSVEEIDQRRNEWFNGLEFDSYDLALITFNNSEATHNQKVSIEAMLDNIQLRADIDFLSMTMEV